MNKKSLLAYPYIIWSALFIVIPLILVVIFSFTINVDGKNVFSLSNYKELIDPIYFKVFFRSIALAGLSTLICLLIGYPVAYIVSKAPLSKRGTLILLFILPMWMNFLLRTYSWMTILEDNGFLTTGLNYIVESINNLAGLNLEPIHLINTRGAVVLGMVYNFLPYMILPIYTVMLKADRSLVEAAQDLGGNKLDVFRNVTIPLSLPGIVSGFTMVFVPSVSTFFISQKLGGTGTTLIGDIIETQFQTANNFNLGASLSFVLMILIFICLAVMNKFSDDDGGVVI